MNKINKKGFFLIEILIYIALSSIFILLLFQFTAQTYKNYKNIQFSNSEISCLWMAIDLISRDINHTSSSISNWKKLSISSIILSLENIDIGWEFKNNNLYRIEGFYDSNKQYWSHKIESLVCKNLEKFQIQFNKPFYYQQSQLSKEPSIKLITIFLSKRISGKEMNIEKSISPKTGVI